MQTLILVIPLGLEKKLYPWGVQCIQEYLACHDPDTAVRIWRPAEALDSLYEQSQEMIAELKPLFKEFGENETHELHFDQDMTRGLTGSLYHFSILSCCGEDFFSICADNNIVVSGAVKKKYSPLLAALKEEFESTLHKDLGAYTENSGKLIFGFTVYDFTFFNALFLASIVKSTLLDSSIIFGGDYFNFPAARELFRKIEWVDGVVVGHGEEVIQKILAAVRHGTSLDSLQIPGLVNEQSQAAGGRESIFEIHPPAVDYSGEKYPTTFVKGDVDSRLIHILTQRGCGWGHCTFCGLLDRKFLYQVNTKRLVQDIDSILPGDDEHPPGSEENNYSIRIESDSNEPDAITAVFNSLTSDRNKHLNFNVWFWFRINRFRKDFALYLFSLQNSNVDYAVELGIESLNPKTLKTMHKGIEPLQLLEAIKSIQDAGGKVGGNYFMFYPLEGVKDVQQEVDLLRQSLHLLSPPQTLLWTIYYHANNRDAIYANQDKFQVKVEEHNDFWADYFFKIGLPFSSYACSFALQTEDSTLDHITHSYFKYLYSADLDRIMAYISEPNDLKKQDVIKDLLRDKPSAFLHHLQFFQEAMDGNKAYWQRFQLHALIRKLVEKYRQQEENKDSVNSLPPEKWPQFFLKENVLIKEFPDPFASSWSVELSQTELQILRYLYWRRDYQDVVEKFRQVLSVSEVEGIIEKHLQMGSLVRSGDTLLSLFHDPEYLSQMCQSEQIHGFYSSCIINGSL